MILEAISDAQRAGARLSRACRIVGISTRTVERWRRDPERGDQRSGPRTRPANALTDAEEAQLVDVMTESWRGADRRDLVAPHDAASRCQTFAARRRVVA